MGILPKACSESVEGSHECLYDLGTVVNKLPDTTVPTPERTALLMTGTDANVPIGSQEPGDSGVVMGVVMGAVNGRERLRTNKENAPDRS